MKYGFISYRDYSIDYFIKSFIANRKIEDISIVDRCSPFSKIVKNLAINFFNINYFEFNRIKKDEEPSIYSAIPMFYYTKFSNKMYNLHIKLFVKNIDILVVFIDDKFKYTDELKLIIKECKSVNKKIIVNKNGEIIE